MPSLIGEWAGVRKHRQGPGELAAPAICAACGQLKATKEPGGDVRIVHQEGILGSA